MDVLRKYDNREAIAVQAHDALLEVPPAADTPPPDDDWINAFTARAQDASSERMRTLWAKVLANEVRAPGAFSLRTLRCISELDADVARKFEQLAPYLMVNILPWMQASPPGAGISFADLLDLQDAGILAPETLSYKVSLNEHGIGHIVGRARVLALEGPPGKTVTFPIKSVTKFGCELLTLVVSHTPLYALKEIAEKLPKVGLTGVSVGILEPEDGFSHSYVRIWPEDLSEGDDLVSRVDRVHGW